MARKRTVSRRTALKVTGAAAATALVAGCSDDDDDGGNGGDDNGGDDSFDIDPDETIEFSAVSSGWEGLAPEEIEGETNPTLNLEDGEDYEIGWTENEDDADHNIEIWDDEEDVVEDYETDEVTDPDDDQMLEITADEDMAYYRCDPHAQMQGDINVE